MLKSGFVIAFILLTGALSAGEIAHYPLRDGKGETAREAADRLPAVRLKGTFWTSHDGLPLIDFGGMAKSRQATAVLPSIRLTGKFTIAVWVRAYWWDRDWAPVVCRTSAVCGIRNNKSHPGQLHFRIKGSGGAKGTNLASDTVLERNRWYHVAAVFRPGRSMRLYIDGKLDSEVTDRVPQDVEAGKDPFCLGGTGKGNYFAGLLADLHFFDHALSDREIEDLYRKENRFGQTADTAFSSPAEGRIVGKLADRVELYESGALKFRVGRSVFRFESSYSYPQKPNMGFNRFSTVPAAGNQPGWLPEVRVNSTEADIRARGGQYEVDRTVKVLPDGRIRIRETLRNLSATDQAAVISHHLYPEKKVGEWYLFGQENAKSAGDARLPSANPTLFIRMGGDALGFVAEDDIFRGLLEVNLAASKDRMRFDPGCRIGIPAGKSHTLEYTIYPLHGSYFDFINLLRADWKVPVQTLNGPIGSCRTYGRRSEVYQKFAAEPEAFRREFERRNMRVITITTPWLKTFSDDETYTRHSRHVMETILAVNPEAKFLSTLVTYYHGLVERDFTKPAPSGFSWTALSPGTVKRIVESPWADSLTLNPAGNPVLYGASEQCLLIMMHPVRGNHFHKIRLAEIDYLLDRAGYDGIYMDMFGFGAQGARQRGSWDGFTVRVDPDGTIAEKYQLLGPLTAPARADWLRKIIGKGKIALTNFGAPTTRELQTIPYWNFCEAAGRGVGRQDLDSIPPDASGCAMNQLSTPLAYGPHRQEETDAVRLMARVRAYLRYGCLYIHTSFRNSFPESGPKGGAYGPINHMYPITPVELQRGWVKGKERIVSCVSYRTSWDRKEKPKALRFDAVGRDKAVGDAVKITGKPGAWNIEVKIDDWKEFLILE